MAAPAASGAAAAGFWAESDGPRGGSGALGAGAASEALGPPSAGAAGFEVCGPVGAVACSGFGGVEPEVLSLFWSLPGWLGVLTRTP
ncbi:hypothetical protein [Rhodococcus erythropolis]|uniref:hypothetical protein n=1 Tax=Rhodococcus erythropolis TaxID=1833 RepID=UPI00038E509F|nr:hypothetical protein [Rhodococcus erythropolis]EQM33691.1 hypothetical protein N601_10195 [Rhodococcus erythropolis DN1]